MIDHFGAPWVARDQYQLRDDARRFETWENSYALRAGLGAAFDYLDSIGIDAIEKCVLELADHCRNLLSQHPTIQLRDIGNHQCGIVSFTVESPDPATIVSQMRDAGFAIGASPASSTLLDAERRNLPTVLRIAPHYYNTKTELEDCVKRLASLL